jgi:cell division protein ZapA (FtsZ GTPase activity inhibitor)
MDKLRVQVNGRGYYLKTDKPDEVLAFAKTFEEKILYIKTKMPSTTEAEATALSALLIMGDALKKERSDEDDALFEELGGKIEILEERKQTLENEIALHNEKEAALEAEIERIKTAYDAEVAALTAENESLRGGLAEAEARCGDVSGKLDESETAVSDVKSALSSANMIIAQLNTEKLTNISQCHCVFIGGNII